MNVKRSIRALSFAIWLSVGFCPIAALSAVGFSFATATATSWGWRIVEAIATWAMAWYAIDFIRGIRELRELRAEFRAIAEMPWPPRQPPDLRVLH